MTGVSTVDDMTTPYEDAMTQGGRRSVFGATAIKSGVNFPYRKKLRLESGSASHLSKKRKVCVLRAII